MGTSCGSDADESADAQSFMEHSGSYSQKKHKRYWLTPKVLAYTKGIGLHGLGDCAPHFFSLIYTSFDGSIRTNPHLCVRRQRFTNTARIIPLRQHSSKKC